MRHLTDMRGIDRIIVGATERDGNGRLHPASGVMPALNDRGMVPLNRGRGGDRQRADRCCKTHVRTYELLIQNAERSCRS